MKIETIIKKPFSGGNQIEGQSVRLEAEQSKGNRFGSEVKANHSLERIVSFDTETYYDDEYSVITHGADAYVEDPHFDCYLVSVVVDGETVYCGAPEGAPWHWFDGATVVSHNTSFDSAVFYRLQEQGIVPEEVQPYRWLDSAAIAVYNGAPRNLQDAAEALLDRDLDKGYRGVAKGRHWGDFSAEEQQQLREACEDDALAAYEIVAQFGSEWPEHELELASIHLTHQRRGIRIDQEGLRKGIVTLKLKKQDLEARMPWVSDGHKPSATKAMSKYISVQGIPVPASFSKKDARYLAWEDRHADRCPAIAAVKEWREVNGLLKRLESMRRRIRRDGRLPVDLLYYGAATGRAAGVGLNMHSLPNGERCGVNIRALLIPEAGHVFVGADLAQIEPRCVATLLKDEKMLEQMREGVSPYEAYARAYLGWTGGKLKVEDPRLYALAKVCVLSLAYGTGWARFREAAAAQGIVLTEQEAQTAVADYRQVNARIVTQWRSLEQRFRAHAGKPEPFVIELPSGRSLRYFDVCYRAEDQSYVARTELGGTYYRFWGSKLFENAIQATARDVFMRMMVEAEREGLRTVLHVHDELLVECRMAEAEQVSAQLTRIMTTPPDWLPDIPLACETKILTHFE